MLARDDVFDVVVDFAGEWSVPFGRAVFSSPEEARDGAFTSTDGVVVLTTDWFTLYVERPC